jgi:lipopolysaccharide export system ATP-binding protein
MTTIKKFRIKSFKKKIPLVKLDKVSLSYSGRQVLDGVTFSVNQGEILGMLGPNGAGKSTIFNLITGLIKPNHGSIIFGQTDATEFPIYIRTSRFKIGYVPQHGGYFHELTLLENLNAIGEIIIKNSLDRKDKIAQLILKFQLDSIKNIKAKFLSGGQRKKLVIALALLSDPEILLLDEPFAALDILTIKMLQQIIVNLQMENKIGICICDHQARDLLSCVDVAIVLSNSKIIAQGTPSQLINDPDAQTAYFGNSFKYN